MYALSVLFTTLASVATVSAANVLYSKEGLRGTVYYDIAAGDLCGQQNGGPFPADWAVTSGINSGIPFCQNLKKGSLAEINSNQIVAMDWNLLQEHPDWCGKEVKVFRADGSEVTVPEGPLVLYDACAACMSSPIVDLSAQAFIEASPDRKCGNNPEGLSVQILDNEPWGAGGSAPEPAQSSPAPAPSSEAPAPSSTSTEAPAPSSSEASQVPEPSAVSSIVKSAELNNNKVFKAQPTVAPTPSDKVSSTLAVPEEVPTSVQPEAVAPTSEAQDGAQCQYGKWSCDGNDLQVCNYITTELLDWECVATCDNYCEVKENGMATCQ